MVAATSSPSLSTSTTAQPPLASLSSVGSVTEPSMNMLPSIAAPGTGPPWFTDLSRAAAG